MGYDIGFLESMSGRRCCHRDRGIANMKENTEVEEDSFQEIEVATSYL